MMSKIQTFKIERDKSNIIHKAIGIIAILIAIILLIPYILHFLKITLAIMLLGTGIYFLTKQTRFRWFRIKRF
ncbi:hypothetical protein KO361_00620 [Candidatus Woesearchaeota archaeon]|nr:hypothetical protein [Candidatus Woesearchaeota archaeon]